MYRVNTPHHTAYLFRLTILFLISFICSTVYASDTIRIYIDADRSVAKSSGLAIERGVRTALNEVNNELAGIKVEVVLKDHRGNTRRSKMHLDQYLADDRALAIFAGLHSPPLLAHRNFINENGILLLNPWAAAGPITRYPSKENWIFRLSIDDTKAGHFIADQAIREEGFRRPFLLLEDTGWGRSNAKTMTSALQQLGTKSGVQLVGITRFNWNTGENQAREILRQIAESGADVIFFVGNAPEGKTFARAMLALKHESRLPIRSHWGITGGDFPDVIDQHMRNKLDLAFIQTRYPFLTGGRLGLEQEVLARTSSLYPKRTVSPQKMRAPAGFYHAYDLTRILIRAVEKIDVDNDIVSARNKVRIALENLEAPIEGLMKTYRRPFRSFETAYPDAHEALTPNDYVMATFDPNGGMRLFSEYVNH